MSINDLKTGIPCLSISGRFGVPNELGEHILGWTQLGDQNNFAGDYQRRKGKKHTIYVRCRRDWPKQSKIGKWQANHDNFANGVTAWRALSPSEQMYYNQLKYPHAQTGFTRFMSQYLKTHKI